MGVDFATCAETGGYVKNLSDSFYMSVITLTTVGFGDYQPRTKLGRLISIPWMVIGFTTFAHLITQLGTYFYEQKKSAKMMAADAVTSIDKETFNKIDKDGNGYLDKGEFMAYTLLKYEVVSEKLIDHIIQEYNSFEGSGDKRVTHEMIAKRQLKPKGNAWRHRIGRHTGKEVGSNHMHKQLKGGMQKLLPCSNEQRGHWSKSPVTGVCRRSFAQSCQ